MARRSFAARLLAVILGVAAAAMLMMAAFAYVELRGLTASARAVTAELGDTAARHSREALVAQAQDFLGRQAAEHAELYNASLQRIEADVTAMALFMEEVAANPERYPARPIEPVPDVRGKIPQLNIARGVEETEDLTAEIGRLGNVTYYIGDAVMVNPSLNAVYVGTETGLLLFYMTEATTITPEYDHRRREWYTSAMAAGGDLVWTGVYEDIFTGEGVLTAARAYFGPDGRPAGVVGADILLTDLLADLEDLRVGASGHVFLVDSGADFIEHTLYAGEAGGAAGDRVGDQAAAELQREYGPALAAMAAGGTGVRRITVDGTAYYLAYAPLPATGWSLGIAAGYDEIVEDAVAMEAEIARQAARLDAEIETLRGRLARDLTLGLLAALGVLAVVALSVARSVTRPITRLSRGVAAVGGGDLDAHIEPGGPDEIGTLAAGFNKMTVDLKEHIAEVTRVTAEQARMNSELRIAGRIQQDLLPRIGPPLAPRDDVHIGALMRPASEVGGDLFDIFFVDEEQTRLAVAVADVAGTSVSAGLFMMTTQALARSNKSLPPAEMLAAMNDVLAEGNSSCMFVTVLVGVLDLETGRFVFANAGHLPPLLLRAGAENPEFLSLHRAPPLGVFPGQRYVAQDLLLAPGDALLLYTDGVTEAFGPGAEVGAEVGADDGGAAGARAGDGGAAGASAGDGDARAGDGAAGAENHGLAAHLYGADRLAADFAALGDAPAQEVVDGIHRAVVDFAAGTPRSDDITMLLFRYLGRPRTRSRDFPATIGDVPAMLDFVREATADLPARAAFDVELASEEALVNIASYAYPGRDDGRVTVTWTTDPAARTAVVRIEDTGIAFDPLGHPPPDLSLPVLERPVGGLGIPMMRQRVDVAYARAGDRNRLTLTRRF